MSPVETYLLFPHYMIGLPAVVIASTICVACLVICCRRPSLRGALMNAFVATVLVNVLVVLFCVVLGSGTWFAMLDSAVVTLEQFTVALAAGTTMICSMVYALTLWKSREK